MDRTDKEREELTEKFMLLIQGEEVAIQEESVPHVLELVEILLDKKVKVKKIDNTTAEIVLDDESKST